MDSDGGRVALRWHLPSSHFTIVAIVVPHWQVAPSPTCCTGGGVVIL